MHDCLHRAWLGDVWELVLAVNWCWINPGEKHNSGCYLCVKAGPIQHVWFQQSRETVRMNCGCRWRLRSCTSSESPVPLTIFIKVWNWAAGAGCNHSAATSCPLIRPPLSFYFNPWSPGVAAGLSQSMEALGQTHWSKLYCISMPLGFNSHFYLLAQALETWESLEIDEPSRSVQTNKRIHRYIKTQEWERSKIHQDFFAVHVLPFFMYPWLIMQWDA